MKNLTENQQSIINSLVKEFTNINQSNILKKSSKNPLLAYCNEVYDIRNKEEEERGAIEIKNKAIELILKNKIEQDHTYLIKLLKEISLSIKAEQKDYCIKLSFDKFELEISYKVDIIECKSFKYLTEILELSDNIWVEFNNKRYENILELMESNSFSASFKRLINKVIQ